MKRLAALLLVLVAGCTSVARPAGDGLVRYRDRMFGTVTVTRDVVYGEAPGADGAPQTLRLDLYQPGGDTVTARPAVVWVHGGGYSAGNKGSGPSPLLARAFAERGYVAVSIDYRLLAPAGCSGGTASSSTCVNAALGAIEDAKAAVRWLRANATTYGVDAGRIGIGGESAGAITAAGVGLTASGDPGRSGNPGFPSDVGGWISISGGLPGGTFVDRGDAPGYLWSGTADRIVPYQWSVDTNAAMLRAGNFVVFKTLEGAGHVPFAENRDLMETQSAYFLYDVLDLGNAARS